MKRSLALAAALLLGAPQAFATVSIVQHNIQVPSTGTLVPGSFLSDGTNIWFGMDLYDGTTWGTLNASDGGLNVHIAGSGNLCSSSFPCVYVQNPGAVDQVQLNGTNYVSVVPANKKPLPGLTNTVVAIDTNPGVLSSIYCANAGTGWAYVQLFDATTGGAVFGTSVPYGIPPGQASGIALPMQGVNFSTAISVAATSTATGSTAPSTALDCTATYN